MQKIVRTLAVSGAAAVALLSGASAASAVGPSTVSAAAVQQATGTPVTLPSGGTVHVTGMESAAYRADSAQLQAVTTLASGEGGAGLGSGNAPAPEMEQGDQVVPQQQTPGQVQPAYGEMQQTASGGAVAGTAVVALVLMVIIGYSIKRGGLAKGHMIACVILGVLLSPTFVGPLVTQLSGSASSSFGNLWAGL
ncbi:hypothetical protein [Streptomyces daliensis]